ncbi:MAG TPA: Xaa-Pro peptidase family protein, partial [Bellilinea sp.]
MKSDLDALMHAHNVDVLLVNGPAYSNPAMMYLTGGGHITHAELIKKRGEQPVLFCGPMEREEAAKTGLSVRLYSDYPLAARLKEANGDAALADALRLKQQLVDLGVTQGRVAIYGVVEAGPLFANLTRVAKMLPELEFTGFVYDPIFDGAMMTKEPAEIERIRKVGKITTEVVGRVADYLTGQRVKNEVLVKPDGQPVTVGMVKSQIDLWLAELGAANPEATIFAIGRDAGVPHSAGTPTDLMRLGRSIVFDIFPCEAGGGYYYDFTRTWSLGYATDEVLSLYEQVHTVYKVLAAGLKAGQPFIEVQQRTNDLFEAMGHKTMRQQSDATEGYIHSIGHGVGLKVHEMPFSGLAAGPEDKLVPGSVFTLEPGLYYPSRNMGVRIEDTYA